MRKKQFSYFSFRSLFGFWAKIFSDFRRKNFKSCQNYLLHVQRNNLWLEFFFKSFESFWIFCRIIGLGSQMSIYVSRVKIAEETVFLFFFAEFFCGFWAKNFSDFRPKNFLKFSKLPSTCPEDQFVAWNSFLKFWIVLDFLQKPSAWFSNFYLRVKSKNCGRNSFLFFFSEFFRILSENFFRLSAKNLQKVVKTTFCVSRGTICDLKYFLKVLNRFDIFCRKLWHGSQISIYVSRVKIAEETVFWFSFQNFFGFWAKIFSDFRQKIFKKLSKLTSACPEEQFVAWIFFLKFWIVLDFLQKPLAWFSNVYLRVQSKNCEERVFWFFFSEFFRILREKFFRLSAKKLHKVLTTTFYVSRGTVCCLNFFSKVLNRFGFSAETFGMVLEFLSTCQE